MEVTRTERGWGGHFCRASECMFRRNTLLDNGAEKVVVSTVGNLISSTTGDLETLDARESYFETMAFKSDPDDSHYHDIDVQKQVFFNSPNNITESGDDNKANEMHEVVVEELTDKLSKGEI